MSFTPQQKNISKEKVLCSAYRLLLKKIQNFDLESTPSSNHGTETLTPKSLQESKGRKQRMVKVQQGWTRLNGNAMPLSGKKKKRIIRGGYILGADAIPVSLSGNFGSRLMQKWGWQPGEGLGKNGAGRPDPLIIYVRPKLSGLGLYAPPKTLSVADQPGSS